MSNNQNPNQPNKISKNAQGYTSLNDLPPELQQTINQALQKFGGNSNLSKTLNSFNNIVKTAQKLGLVKSSLPLEQLDSIQTLINNPKSLDETFNQSSSTTLNQPLAGNNPINNQSQIKPQPPIIQNQIQSNNSPNTFQPQNHGIKTDTIQKTIFILWLTGIIIYLYHTKVINWPF